MSETANVDISAEVAELDALIGEIHALQARKRTSSDAEKIEIDKLINRKQWAKHDLKVKKIAPKLGLGENTSATPVTEFVKEWRIVNHKPEPAEIPAELPLTGRISILGNQNKFLETRIKNLEERLEKLERLVGV